MIGLLTIGVDLGTSNSSVAVYDGRSSRLLPLDPLADDPRVMRSLLYIARDGEIHAGRRALETYSAQNTGREVKYERRIVGEISMTFAEVGTRTGVVVAEIDANEPGRLFQSLKRFLPEKSFTDTDVFGKAYSLEMLIGLLARAIVDAAEREVGEPVRSIVAGRPVRFSVDPARDALARKRLEAGWRLAGVEDVRYLEEPAAAMYHFSTENEVEVGSRVLVFDFGGGTLDITVARRRKDGVEMLSTAGIPLGGDRIDSRLMQALVASSFGDQAHYRLTGLPLPAHIFARLSSWQSIIELNRPEFLNVIRRAVRETDRPRDIAALEALVTRNYGLDLFRAIEMAKIDLTDQMQAVVTLRRQGLDISRPVSRAEFEAAVRSLVLEAADCVGEALEMAGCDPGEIGYLVTTGGSSLIPAFRRMLQKGMPNATLFESDTFTSVASGLALWGSRN